MTKVQNDAEEVPEMMKSSLLCQITKRRYRIGSFCSRYVLSKNC